MTVAAVMPLPEGMSELTIAGVLGRRRVPMICGTVPIFVGTVPISRQRKWDCPPRPRRSAADLADADFCITGYLDPSGSSPRARSAITWATTVCRRLPSHAS